MVDEINTEINRLCEELNNTALSDERRSALIKELDQMVVIGLKIDKAQSDEYAIEDAKETKDRELKLREKSEKRNLYLALATGGITLLTAGLSLFGTMWAVKKTLLFEETGHVCSLAGKAILQNAVRK